MPEMTSNPSSPVTLTRPAPHVALVEICRPQAKNAVNGEVAQGIDAIVSQTEADPDIWAVILTGAGGDVFCAGADLKEVSRGGMASLFTPNGGFAGFVKAKRQKPWIAAVEGLALAGGCEIALACDMIVATRGGAFGLPEVKRGLIASAGGLFRLPRVIPRAIAIEMALTAGRLSSERAEQLGLVNHLVDPGNAVSRALELAAEICANAPLAVRESLALIKASPDLDEAALWTWSDDAQDRLSKTADFAEGPLAFIEKRAPQWKGF